MYRFPRIRRGGWDPFTTDPILLAVQAVALYLAGARGWDYMLRRNGPPQPGLLGVVEQAAPLWVWGVLFVSGVAIALTGIAGGWARLVITGHLMLACWYGGTGTGLMLTGRYDIGWPGTLGLLASGIGAAAVLSRQRVVATWVRLLGVVVMLAGQQVVSVDLGPDYRQGFSQLGAAGLHIVCLVGTWVLYRRQRLRAIVAAEVERGPDAVRPRGPSSGPIDLGEIERRLGELVEYKRSDLRAISARLAADDPDEEGRHSGPG